MAQEIQETFVMESMENESISIGNGTPGDIQYYVYDQSQILNDTTEDLNNITDLILEDGTRAMLVNGTLLTADGQTLILQDGSDISQYCLDDTTGQIFVSQDQEELFTTIAPQNEQTVKIDEFVKIEDEFSNERPNLEIMDQENQALFYIQETDINMPQETYEYQLAEMNMENQNDSMHIVQIENQENLAVTQEIVDLDDFLSQHGLVQMDGENNYQYAVLKDGKIHLHTSEAEPNLSEHIRTHDYINTSMEEEVEKQEESLIKREVVEARPPVNEAVHFDWQEEREVDLSGIRGRNMLTGQPVTLTRYMDKIQNNLAREKENQKKLLLNKPKNLVNPNLKGLINRKLTIGKTDKGKLLVGKIVNVVKKDERIDRFKDFSNSLSRTKKFFSKKPQVNNLNSQKTPSRQTILTRELGPSKDTKKYSIITDQTNQRIRQNNDDIHQEILPENVENHENESEISETNEKTETNYPERPKIIVQQKFVKKDCFQVISRTLSGLMNMNSVVQQLKNKTIIVKVLEKSYDHTSGDYKKSISYCSGYMVREYKVDAETDSFSENWMFIPDSNSKSVIFGENRVGDNGNCEDSNIVSANKRIANVTIQISINEEGRRNTKVIVNPPNMYRCQFCNVTFRKSVDLQNHLESCKTTNSDPKETSNLPVTLNDQFIKRSGETNQSLSTNKARSFDGRKVFSCEICGRQFSRHSNLQRHVQIHEGDGTMYKCSLCSCYYYYASSLTRHVMQCHLEKPSIKTYSLIL